MIMSDFDRAEWHFGAEDFPRDLKKFQAYVHIGFYLGWLVDRNLAAESLVEEFSAEIKKFKEKKITAPQMAKSTYEGGLSGDLMNDDGYGFSRHYYEDGQYFTDLETEFKADKLPTLYHLPDSEANFERTKKFLDEAYQNWVKGGRPAPEEKVEKIWFEPIPDDRLDEAIKFVRKSLSPGVFAKAPFEISLLEHFRSYQFVVRVKDDEYSAVNARFNKVNDKIFSYFKPLTERNIQFSIDRFSKRVKAQSDTEYFHDPYRQYDYKKRIAKVRPAPTSIDPLKLELILGDLKAFIERAQPQHSFRVECNDGEPLYEVNIHAHPTDFLSICNLISRHGIEMFDRFKKSTNKAVNILVHKKSD